MKNIAENVQKTLGFLKIGSYNRVNVPDKFRLRKNYCAFEGYPQKVDTYLNREVGSNGKDTE